MANLSYDCICPSSSQRMGDGLCHCTLRAILRRDATSAELNVVASAPCGAALGCEVRAPDAVGPAAHVLPELPEFARVLLHRYRRAVLGVEVMDEEADRERNRSGSGPWSSRRAPLWLQRTWLTPSR